ncbi:unnamed protein product [Rhizoctonia solani]|uniref:4a-hydroxytetrahydrobiopterin dehydratase n=1 Tax=Rhizoctonia solani TaxID=456999 RepID=A0A8H3E578_9AGAM|nr:unnamed protein product [Rhizoctonia solani]
MLAFGLVRTSKILAALNPPSRSRVDTASANPLPPPPPPAPVPLITRQDLEGHINILRERGWHFRQASRRFNELGYTATWWELRHSGRFPSFKKAMEYVNDIADLAKSEKHHPTILIFDRVNVAISLDTHDTIERPAMVSKLPESHAVVARWPGITLRDIRMALLISPLLDEHKVVERVRPADDLNPSYEELLSVRIDK